MREQLQKLNVDDRAGHGAGDARHRLHPGDHQLAELVDTRCFGAHDDVVRTGHIFGQRDALDGTNGMRDLGLQRAVSSQSQGALSARDSRPRTLADVRHATWSERAVGTRERGWLQ